jgi:hypothetical protein
MCKTLVIIRTRELPLFGEEEDLLQQDYPRSLPMGLAYQHPTSREKEASYKDMKVHNGPL